MNATKRKFNALLQGLSNPPPTSQDKSSSGTAGSRMTSSKNMDYEALLQKRRRLGFPESTAPKFDSISTGISTGITNLAASLKRVNRETENKLRKDPPARYSPSDRDELLRRLATFQEITDWTPKPDRINEVEWAKRGWVCQGKERVRCLLCHKELVVKLKKEVANGKEVDESTASELEEALVNKYAELIVSSHQSDCLWRRQGCDNSLLRLSFTNTKVVIEALKKRYQELCARQSFLPYEFNLRLPEDMDLEEVIRHLPPDFFVTDKDAEGSPNRPALALALLGWQGLTNTRIGAVPNSASCHTCLRRLGLWMFKSKEVDEQGQVLVPAPMDHLDPVREHRFFCPWKSASAQTRGNTSSKGDDKPAWKTLIQSIKNDSDLRSLYEGGAKSPSKSTAKPTTAPSTPARTTSGADSTPSLAIYGTPGSVNTVHDDEAVRDAKDKERWARLRKVKSLFDTKKLRRSMTSRPGTSRSTKSAKETTS
ncbi:hypothetical protein PT974_01932 [Cladobotryum mycophilum]|uniref:Uncharacterized protein n=1 Tax=Cladobotryum mycophilum TaxID=491253 RepID=A0ABR0SWM3_9HYPO